MRSSARRVSRRPWPGVIDATTSVWPTLDERVDRTPDPGFGNGIRPYDRQGRTRRRVSEGGLTEDRRHRDAGGARVSDTVPPGRPAPRHLDRRGADASA